MAGSTRKTKTSSQKTSGNSNKRRKTTAKTNHNKEFYNEIFLVCGIALSLLLMLSSFNLIGKLGEIINFVTFGLIGVCAYIFPFILFIVVFILVANKGSRLAKKKMIYSFIFVCLVASMIHLFEYNDKVKLGPHFKECATGKSHGGFIGAAVVNIMRPLVGMTGSFIILTALLIIMVILISEKLIVSNITKGSINALKNLRDDYKNSSYEEDDYYEEDDIPVKRRKPATTFKFDKDGSGDDAVESAPLEKKNLKEIQKSSSKKQKRMPSGMKQLNNEEDYNDVIANQPVTTQMPSSVTIDKKTGEIYETELAKKFGKKKNTEPKSTEDNITKENIIEENKNLPNLHGAQFNNDKPQVQETKEPAKTSESKALDAPKVEVAPKTINELPKAAPASNTSYQKPPIDLLSKPKGVVKGDSGQEHYETAHKLEQTLESFGVKVTITDISVGPTVTRYEMQPEQGVKVSRITNLADDIKLNLAATDIRIEAPIPGKAAVGIEVPNKETTAVSFREILESKEFETSTSKIAFAVGKDLAGQPVVTDIAKMPHLLIAGQTGSGKSVCINTLIMSILYKYHPDDVKMIMVDPKVVELSVYNGIPHLMIPVVTDPKKASSALNWAVAEMVDRYNKFAQLGVRDMAGYNAKIATVENSADAGFVKMPQIVIIVDELADLMMVAPGEVEDAICRLAQMARAAGIHLVIATQRPSVNVITGLIKANVPSRIAFSVASAIDSRTILDSGGAEKLLGKGDMLFYPSGYPKPVRLQGAFVSDSEVSAVVDFLSANNNNTYSEEVIEKIETASMKSVLSEGKDESADSKDQYFEQAGRFIIEKDKASIGMLQRVYKIGFNRAARIMDQLADAGVVGPEEGTKPRRILMTMEEFEQYLNDSAG